MVNPIPTNPSQTLEEADEEHHHHHEQPLLQETSSAISHRNQQQHIRPSKRRTQKNHNISKNDSVVPVTDDQIVDQSQQEQSQHESNQLRTIVDDVVESSLTTGSNTSKVLNSILRKTPKYTTSSKVISSTNASIIDIDEFEMNNNTFNTGKTDISHDVSTKYQTTSLQASHEQRLPPIQQDHVIEKPRKNRISRRNNTNNIIKRESILSTDQSNKPNVGISSNMNIEGYVPQTTLPKTTTELRSQNTSTASTSDVSSDTILDIDDDNERDVSQLNCDNNDGGSDEPLIFNSVADLMAMAGTLPSVNDKCSSTTSNNETTDNDPSSTPKNTTTNALMIETQLDFSVLDPNEYQQEQQKIFLGRISIPKPKTTETAFDISNDNDKNDTIHDHDCRKTLREQLPHDDDYDSDVDYRSDDNDAHRSKYSNNNNNNNINDDDDSSDSDDENDDILLDALSGYRNHVVNINVNDESDEDEDKAYASPPPRTFLIFWTAIAQWVTPYAVSYIYHLQNVPINEWDNNTMNDDKTFVYQQLNDIALSRYHGFMSLIQFQTTRCWNEYMAHLHGTGTTISTSTSIQDECTISNLRKAEKRIAILLRCFDYCRPTPKWTIIQIRAFTCILLDMVSTTKRINPLVPIPCQTLGMTYEEYNYLVQSSILSFRTDDLGK